MSSHRYHPDSAKGDPEGAKLFDDCERCDEQADKLYGLDQFNLIWFWSAMDQTKHDDKPIFRKWTRNEQKAIQRMYEMATIIERMTGIWPSPSNLMTLKVNQ